MMPKNLDLFLQESIGIIPPHHPHSVNKRLLEIMHKIYTDIKQRVDHSLAFGPCNSHFAEKIKGVIYSRKELFFTHSPEALKAIAAIRSKDKLSNDIREGSYIENEDLFKNIAFKGFLSATGTCETYAVLGALYLSQLYDVNITIENLHSDSTHTYLRLHTCYHDYIFDFWSDACVRYGNWIDWNESVNYEYRYTKSTRFSLLAAPPKPEILIEIAAEMHSSDMTAAREKHIHNIRSITWGTVDKENVIIYNQDVEKSACAQCAMN